MIFDLRGLEENCRAEWHKQLLVGPIQGERPSSLTCLWFQIGCKRGIPTVPSLLLALDPPKSWGLKLWVTQEEVDAEPQALRA